MLLLKKDMLTDISYFIIKFNILQCNISQWTMICRESKHLKIVVRYGMLIFAIPYQVTIQLIIKFIAFLASGDPLE